MLFLYKIKHLKSSQKTDLCPILINLYRIGHLKSSATMVQTVGALRRFWISPCTEAPSNCQFWDFFTKLGIGHPRTKSCQRTSLCADLSICMVNVNKFAQKWASEFLAKTIAENYRVAQISSITLSRFVSPRSILINLHKFKHLAFSQKHAQTNIALRWKPRWNLRNRAWLCADVHRRLTQICQFIVNLNQFVQKIGSWNLCKSWRKRISFAQIFIIALRRFGNPWSILINLYKTRHLIPPQNLLQTNLALRRKCGLNIIPPKLNTLFLLSEKPWANRSLKKTSFQTSQNFPEPQPIYLHRAKKQQLQVQRRRWC